MSICHLLEVPSTKLRTSCGEEIVQQLLLRSELSWRSSLAQENPNGDIKTLFVTNKLELIWANTTEK